MLNRLIGVITLNRNTYREIALDTGATTQAGIVVVMVTLHAARKPIGRRPETAGSGKRRRGL